MADIREFLVSMNLSGDLSDTEIAELRWHLGLGPQPEEFTIITDFTNTDIDEDGNPVTINEPYPVWGREPYPARRIGGVVFSLLVHEETEWGGRWALTCRWEIHPEQHEIVAKLFDWLATYETDHGFMGYLRWYEDDWPEWPVGIEGGALVVHHEQGFEPFAQAALLRA
ncbi:hypothetical protein GCM10022225_18740 [Plantactinospora mayteni]|uniref:Uncharacterized protein n=1 Tax=Plantactinospora mayteni TaxID=566021 RepID=A0ABQ4EN55_9ACTN|nr:hypothetical protein [Plantactinospora mayteni]GIG96059.1 hypothetical protein Pma05_26320 [Plantactinospora mayteni]